MIKALVDAGMDVARIPLAHGTIAEAVKLVRRVREVAPNIAIMPDLPGPKVRSTPFPGAGVTLRTGAEVLLVPGSSAPESTESRIGVDLDVVVAGLRVGDIVALGDGGTSLVVTAREADGVLSTVRAGGNLMGRPGVTAPAGSIQLATPTPEDLERIAALAVEDIDALAVSFVRCAEDLDAVRDALGNPDTMLVAKIETPEAIADLDAIVRSGTRSWSREATSACGCRSRTSLTTRSRSSTPASASAVP